MGKNSKQQHGGSPPTSNRNSPARSERSDTAEAVPKDKKSKKDKKDKHAKPREEQEEETNHIVANVPRRSRSSSKSSAQEETQGRRHRRRSHDSDDESVEEVDDDIDRASAGVYTFRPMDDDDDDHDDNRALVKKWFGRSHGSKTKFLHVSKYADASTLMSIGIPHVVKHLRAKKIKPNDIEFLSGICKILPNISALLYSYARNTKPRDRDGTNDDFIEGLYSKYQADMENDGEFNALKVEIKAEVGTLVEKVLKKTLFSVCKTINSDRAQLPDHVTGYHYLKPTDERQAKVVAKRRLEFLSNVYHQISTESTNERYISRWNKKNIKKSTKDEDKSSITKLGKKVYKTQVALLGKVVQLLAENPELHVSQKFSQAITKFFMRFVIIDEDKKIDAIKRKIDSSDVQAIDELITEARNEDEANGTTEDTHSQLTALAFNRRMYEVIIGGKLENGKRVLVEDKDSMEGASFWAQSVFFVE